MNSAVVVRCNSEPLADLAGDRRCRWKVPVLEWRAVRDRLVGRGYAPCVVELVESLLVWSSIDFTAALPEVHQEASDKGLGKPHQDKVWIRVRGPIGRIFAQSEPFPAATTLRVDLLEPGMLVEISAIAAVGAVRR